jgi:probable HAF family extracellular repeat protein
MRRQILVLVAVLAFLYPVCAQAAIVYEVIDLGTLGGDESHAYSINDAGRIVGWANDSEGNLRATSFDPTGAGNNIDLGTLGGDEGEARCINNIGQIVGYALNSQGYRRATLFDPTGAGNNTALGVGGAYSINDARQIVGISLNSDGRERATLFDSSGAGNNIDLGTLGGDWSDAYSINDAGQIVGEAYVSTGEPRYRATLFDPTGDGNNIDLGAGRKSTAYSINNAGQIVGESGSFYDKHATLFDPTGAGNNIDLGALGGSESWAWSINDAGQIVGWADERLGRTGSRVRATLFDPTGAGNNIDLNTLIDPASGWTLLGAYDINNSGWIVGYGINPEEKNHAFLLVPIDTKYSGGTGEPNDPYQISTAEDLMLLGESPEDYDKHFILTADIDLDPNLPGRKVFDRAVIAPDTNNIEDNFQGISFAGIFDGNDHTISNLSITGVSYLGLFGQLGMEAIISNLIIESVNISVVGENIGGLAGLNAGKISGCSTHGFVYGVNGVGGLAGRNRGSVTESYSTTTTGGEARVGGLVGSNYTYSALRDDNSWGEGTGKITSCFSTGSVSGNEYIGGLAGMNHWEAHITTCYSTGTVTGGDYVGGLVGINEGNLGGHGIIDTTYSTGMVDGTGSNVGGLVGFTWDFIESSFWDVETSGFLTSYGGTGKTTAEMKMTSTFVGWWCTSVWTIDEGNGYPHLWWEDRYEELMSNPHWDGSGTEDDPYLIYTAEQLNTIGLIHCDWDKHFKLMADIDLNNYKSDEFNIIGGKISIHQRNVWFPESFIGVFDGNGHTISNFTYDCNEVNFVGLFGSVYNAVIKDLGLVETKINAYVGNNVGSLVGYSWGGIITGCFVHNGNITGGEGVGGLVGTNFAGSVTNCYSTGKVNGSNSLYGGVGGLLGSNFGSIRMSYSTCTVTGDGLIGGLVGNNNDDAIINSSFWDVESSGLLISDGGISKTTAEMQTASTFLEAGWDFVDEVTNGTDDIWWILEGQDYPRLWWETEEN